MGKGFGMEQKGSDNNLYRAQKPLLQPQMAPCIEVRWGKDLASDREEDNNLYHAQEPLLQPQVAP
jgi:hypothetical protein